MKKLPLIITCVSLSISSQAYADGWFDSLKNFIGLGDKKEQTNVNEPATAQSASDLSIGAIINSISSSLDISNTQAEGGIASLFNYAKSNLSSGDFSQLAKQIPGADTILSKVPSTSGLKSEQGAGSLLDKAAEYSDSMKSINNVKKQFEALGLKPEMIASFVSQIQGYLSSDEGKEAKDLLMKGFKSFAQ